MFLRKKPNASGSISVQIISKANSSYKVIKTIGSGSSEQEIQKLWLLGEQNLERLNIQSNSSSSEKTFSETKSPDFKNATTRTIGPELIFGKLYDFIGFNEIKETLFRHLVISRITYPLSKLKAIEYVNQYLGIKLDIATIYSFLDTFPPTLTDQVQQIAFNYINKVSVNPINISLFYMFPLHFEACDKKELRKIGLRKEGIHKTPQIYLGVISGSDGHPIGYEIFHGNIYEGYLLIPFLEKVTGKFNLNHLIIVAGAELLSNMTIKILEQKGYEYIIGTRLKDESQKIKQQILGKQWKDGEIMKRKKMKETRLIVTYTGNDAIQDQRNRQRGLDRLEKEIQSGNLTRRHINNIGYNQYLKMLGTANISVDYTKFNIDKKWEGIKGYITNSKLTSKLVIKNYENLEHINKAFRMSKIDLYPHSFCVAVEDRIKAHICISFTAYSIWVELGCLLRKEKSILSIQKAAALTHSIYEITHTKTYFNYSTTKLPIMDDEQAELYRIIYKNC